jgi:predicted secreted protein
MKWTSVLAIYFLIFCFTAFLLLPFGVKTHEEVGAERVPGMIAPLSFRSAASSDEGSGTRRCYGAHVANYVNG